jgi:hypothetical protein
MPSIFTSKTEKPNKIVLTDALQSTYKIWEELKETLINEHGKLLEEWKYYGPKTGWLLKFFYKTKNLFFLIPSEKFFTLAFVFGDKAISEIENSDLPEKIKEELRNTKKYAEGKGLRIEIRKKGDLKSIIKLVRIKITS